MVSFNSSHNKIKVCAHFYEQLITLNVMSAMDLISFKVESATCLNSFDGRRWMFHKDYVFMLYT